LLDRNIVTKGDKDKFIAEQRIQVEAMRDLGEMHPERADFGDDGLDRSKSEPDTPASRITKYFPGEALAFFLAMAGIFNVENEQLSSNLLPWAVGIVFLSLAFNVLYLKKVWHVSRNSQIAVSTIALLIYIFATGGELISSIPGYSGFLASFALVVVTAFLAFFDPPGPAK